MTWKIFFWCAFALTFYAYAGYPFLAWILARYRGTAPRTGTFEPALTVVIAARNEAPRIVDRVRNILAQDYPAAKLAILVVSNGSDDGTVDRVRSLDEPRLQVIDLPEDAGKAAALNAAMAHANSPLVVFADARQRFAPGALHALVAAFADPAIGAVSGELVIEPLSTGPATHATGLYWRLEKRLRFDEARLGWLHGVTGAIHAVRRDLFKPMPVGTILDDMWIPMHVILSGHRVWMSREAIAFDTPSADTAEEFRRKLRTLAGNWQLMARLPAMLDPLLNPVFFAWFSHKFLRLLAPWALLVMLLASSLLPGGFFRVVLVLQLAAYAMATLALLAPRMASRVPFLPAAGTFLMLNAAALASLPVSLASRPAQLWRKH